MQLPRYEVWPQPKVGERFIVTMTPTEGPILRFLRRIGLVRDELVTTVTHYEVGQDLQWKEITK